MNIADHLYCQCTALVHHLHAESRHIEQEHVSGRRRVADEDDTVLDDAHESSSVASQDRGDLHHFLCAIKLSEILVLVCSFHP